MADLVLGFDFGTSAVKAALLRRDGAIAAHAERSYPLHLPQPGWAEQAPQDWERAMQVVVADLIKAIPDAAARVAAIGLSAQMGGVIPVDAEGTVLHPALIWLDTRSAAVAREIAGGKLSVAGYEPLKLARWLWLTGGAPSLSGKDAISKIVWLNRNRAELWPRVHKLLDVKDYLLARCTGRFVTSYDCAHLTWLFDARNGRRSWSAQLLRVIGLDRALLPDIARATDLAGGLTARAASALGLRQGTPVSVGAGDVAAAAIGAGDPGGGALHLYLGTSAWLAARVPRSRVDPRTGIGCLTSADGDGFLLIATQENAGSCLEWGRKLLGLAEGDFSGFEATARRFEPTPHVAMFFPWLAGERVPVDDPRIRGGFAGLSLASGPEEIAFAIHEGVALNVRWAMRSFDRLSGRPAQRLRLVGGGARNLFWAQMFADVLGREIEVMEAPEYCGTRGAALIAAVAAGWHANLDSAAAMIAAGRIFLPDATASSHYDRRFAAYAGYYPRLRGWRLP
ncbi:MAG: FGGY-family carbohydrate kinase [Alphaproteobacteria bacterium]|nr:FGGY-family carbohydrate kinase [Alphaproteobacteria bacterium]